MRRLTLTTLCALVWLQAAAAQADDGRAALNRIYSPQERERLLSLKSLTLETQVSAFGMRGGGVSHFAAPDRFTVTYILPLLTVTQTYNAGSGWMIDQNGAVTPLSGSDLQALVTQIYFSGYAFLREDDSSQIELIGASERTGRGCLDFHITPSGGLPVDVSIDSATGDILFARVFKDDISMDVTYGDFRDVDGHQIPFAVTTVASTPLLNMSESVSAAHVNPQLDPVLFAPPAAGREAAGSRRADFAFPTETTSITAPLEYRDGHVFVRVRVNGSRPLRMLLDSGAGVSALTRATVDSLGLTTVGELPGKGISGYTAVGLVRIEKFALGDLTLLDRSVGAIDLPAEMQAALGGIDGIIGFELLHAFAVQLDFTQQTLTVFHPEKTPETFPGFALPVTFTMKVPTVEATIGSASGSFLVDIGNQTGVVIHRAFAVHVGLDTLPSQTITGQRAVSGIGGSTVVREVYLPSLRLDTAIFRDTP
ncbi:MAG TPA: aspartyl protease family protein, partial [candidate division Zixibacteria bacterium]|nr:aspartyl protease family protein [candidate division Zixibacteria bacterium]